MSIVTNKKTEVHIPPASREACSSETVSLNTQIK